MLAFNRLVVFVAACLSTQTLTTAVQAQDVTICFTDSVPLQNTNWTASVTVPKFNAALGTLQQVTFRLDSHVEGFARVESLDSSATTVQTFYAASISLQRPDSSVIVTGLPNVMFSDPLAPYDGTTDFAGPSGASHNGLSLNSTDNHISPPPLSDLALFTGPGTITLPVVGQGQSQAVGSGNVITQFMTRASAVVQVCYVYTPCACTNAPVFSGCTPGTVKLGCNPANVPGCSTAVTASDNCEPIPVTCTISDTASGCNKTRVVTYSATNACGTSTCARTYTWTEDTTPPTFDNCVNGNTDLGCNPTVLPLCRAGVTASDNCGPAGVDCTFTDSVNGCVTTRTFVYTARDVCNNTATCTRTFTWRVDTTPPTFDNCTGGNTDLGCNPTVLPTCSTSITASDNCGPATVTCASSDAVLGCITTRTLVYTARDLCNNTATCTRTFTWKVDTTPPTFTNCLPGNTDLGCNPTVLPTCSTTIAAIDNCGPATVTCASSDAVLGCITTRTFVYTATDACNNTATCTKTFTWKIDTTPPTFTNCTPGNADLGCNPTVLPTCSTGITAIDNCGPATVTCASSDAVNGCVTTRSLVYTATDACNNTATCTRTFTWTVDTTPPTFDNCIPGNTNLGCNPTVLPSCADVTASDNCGPATVTCASSDAVLGCVTTRTIVYTATDACNNTATCTRTFTWAVDTTPPTFTNCVPGNTDLGCNPTVLPTCSTTIAAVDNCGPATVTCASSDAVLGCITTRTFVYTATDACNNTATCTKTFTWTVDVTPPTFTNCVPGNTDLGCNPTVLPTCSTTVTAVDNCGPATVTCASSDAVLGCITTRTFVYTATDACNNTAACTRTFTWTVDTTPPTFDNCTPGNTDLGCNPTVLPTCSTSITASDNCGPATVTCASSDAVLGCITTRTFVYTARDTCNNTATCTKTFTWKVDTTPPTFTNCALGNNDQGCNPLTLPTCNPNITAVDDCGPATVTCTSSDSIVGCQTTRTFVYTATDACNNTATCTRTATWKIDTTPPTFTNCTPGNTDLGCNPAVLPTCSTSITAVDNCGPATVTCASSDAVSGCVTTRTFVYTATDACGNSATCTRSFTWKVDTTSPTFDTCLNSIVDLGCNPTVLPTCDSSVTATDNCGPATVTCSFSDSVNGCVTTRTILYVAQDGCSNTARCTKRYTWTVDVTPPTFDNCTPGNTDLGCNPAVLPTCSASITASDNCGPATVTCASSDAVNGCITTRTFVYTARDACNNTATCTKTVTWKVDVTPPTFTNCTPGNTDLGCNPTVLPTCSATITATDACGPATVTCASSDSVSGCVTTRTFVYTATDACNNTATCTKTFTWKVDTTPPTFTNCTPGNTDLGCNPATLPTCSATITATDTCGPATVTCSSSDSVSGCVTTRTFVYTATDACNNTATCTKTFTWKVDTTPPTFTNCTPGNTDLGCNPTVLPTCSATITATDACGPATVTCASSDSVSGCVTTRTFVYTATDACNNTATCTKTFTWKVDTTPPTFTNCTPGNTDLGCSPATLPRCSTGITATDNCGPATVTCASSDSVSGCTTTRTFVYTATDACNNTATCTRTFTWRVDTTPPTFTNCTPGNTDLGCNPAVLPTCSSTITATDNCGTPTVTCTSSDSVSGCTTTRTFVYTAKDGCNNTTKCTRTFTWKVDTTPPTFTNCTPGNTDLGCNPTVLPRCSTSITATDNCGTPTVTCASSDAVVGCVTTRTFVYTARDACNNTSTCSKTFTWKTDTTAPTFDNCTSGTTDLGCNPATLPTCGGVTASDNCGPATVTCTSSDSTNGCVKTRTLVYTARDGCNNTAKCTRTFTWKTDTTAPTFTNCTTGTTNLGNNPSSIPSCDSSVRASDNCGPATVTCASSDSQSGCNHTRTIVYTATDACNNTSTCTKTYTWTTSSGICVTKFYDANANGVQDSGEPGISRWKFRLNTGATVMTNSSGQACFTGLSNGTYTVTELSPTQTNWVATTPTSCQVTLSSTNCSATCTFGNYCWDPPKDGKTIAYWRSTSGKRVLENHDIEWRQVINGLNLRNADGTFYTVSESASFTTAYNAFSAWLGAATQTNMAYMLSAQFAATVLSVAYHGLDYDQTVLVPGGQKLASGTCMVPFLSTTQSITCGTPPLLTLTTQAGSTSCGCTSNNGSATILSILERAYCLLGTYNLTTSASTARTYEEAVEDLLDMINNNGNNGYACGGLTKYIHESASSCPINFP